MKGQQYKEKVREVRDLARRRIGWETTINAGLNLDCCAGHPYMEALRLLANSYKHNPSMQPDADLLALLGLPTGVNYAPLPESLDLQQGLAAFIGLGKDAVYCDIAGRFVDIASGFLADVENRTKLSPVKWDPTSFDPSETPR